MGFSPDQVEAMSLWQFNAAFDGWKQQNGVEEKPNMLSDAWFDKFDEMAGNA